MVVFLVSIGVVLWLLMGWYGQAVAETYFRRKFGDTHFLMKRLHKENIWVSFFILGGLPGLAASLVWVRKRTGEWMLKPTWNIWQTHS